MQAALRARLIAGPAVAALAGDRVHWVQRPQQGSLPAITLQTISDPRPLTYEGEPVMRSTRVQLDAWGESYAEARALATAAIETVKPPAQQGGVRFGRIRIENEQDLGERTETSFIHRVSVDLIVWHQPG